MTKSFRLLISAGEVSGDLQGSLLIRALRQKADQEGWSLHIDALGGAQMQAQGATLLANTTQLGAIGVLEALPYVRQAWFIRQHLERHLQTTPPDVAILIDCPGFNLSLAAYLKRKYSHIPVLYYIAPQEWVWAWSGGPTRTVVQNTDEVLAIFPQEAEYYKTHGATVTWVGHPFIDTLADVPRRPEARRQLHIPESQMAIALLPASRQQELRHIWPTLAQAARLIQDQIPTVHYWIPVANASFRPTLQATIDQLGLQATLTEQSQGALAAADLAIGKSGTANLEAALLDVPQIVLYRLNPVSGWLYRHLLRFQTAFISPVNIVRQTLAVPELLQEAATPEAIATLAVELLQEPTQQQQMRQHYRLIREQLGTPGVLARAAEAIFAHLLGSHRRGS
ncbi:MAG TPA: lipid-A-disaccharide synthase [Stenomitos sp.]